MDGCDSCLCSCDVSKFLDRASQAEIVSGSQRTANEDTSKKLGSWKRLEAQQSAQRGEGGTEGWADRNNGTAGSGSGKQRTPDSKEPEGGRSLDRRLGGCNAGCLQTEEDPERGGSREDARGIDEDGTESESEEPVVAEQVTEDAGSESGVEEGETEEELIDPGVDPLEESSQGPDSVWVDEMRGLPVRTARVPSEAEQKEHMRHLIRELESDLGEPSEARAAEAKC
jgi:hypothetical protein